MVTRLASTEPTPSRLGPGSEYPSSRDFRHGSSGLLWLAMAGARCRKAPAPRREVGGPRGPPLPLQS